ncbi:hypothetical protein EYC84_004671 [Monilinia fructicola]|uniref:Uncharacterized protein n=1 Tax=Monilinia fructicola TaxID=38448 RepID=A0A5M9K4B7_MONFR|nr:hypothetical protein EYC84_004671 [Monilinia fructicola]
MTITDGFHHPYDTESQMGLTRCNTKAIVVRATDQTQQYTAAENTASSSLRSILYLILIIYFIIKQIYSRVATKKQITYSRIRFSSQSTKRGQTLCGRKKQSSFL